MTNNKTSFLNTTLLYSFALILFLEWLYPVQLVSDVHNITVFILYALFCFVVSMLRLNWWLSMPLKAFGLIFIIDRLFMKPAFLSSAWFLEVYNEMDFNMSKLLSYDWYALTPLFRSLLFLLLIWMLSYLLFHWFIVMKRVFPFILLTFIYLAVLDTFTPYNADAAIVRTFIVSAASLGMINLAHESKREKLDVAWLKKAPQWLGPLVVMIVLSLAAGYAAPKFDSQWPDPVPFIQNAAEHTDKPQDDSGVPKSGYGENDRHLGGSFLQDDSTVFKAAVEDEFYWRVETKDVYTGKGWKKSRDSDYELESGSAIDLNTFSSDVDTENREAYIFFQEDINMEKFVYPYGITELKTGKTDVPDFKIDDMFGDIKPTPNDIPSTEKVYTVTYNDPSFSEERLKQASQLNDPNELLSHYTQLPDSLPDRVKDLAKEITEEDDNRYDKAKSVESYFGENGYKYQISNVPVPEGNQDYVDQFLFDSKKGYCDNYSTSMVVMLRSLDIPARWVKGFTSGEPMSNRDADISDDKDMYEITGANAHSWPEVYFPDSGWVPFEPTQGFSNLSDISETSESKDEEDEEAEEDKEQEEQQETEEMPDEQEEIEGQASDESIHFGWFISAGASFLALMIMLMYHKRFQLRTAYIFRKWQKYSDKKTFQEAYHLLLKLLESKGFSKKPDETLREFAGKIDAFYQSSDMGRLTDSYEAMLYNYTDNQDVSKELSYVWRGFMKTVMG